MSVRVVIADDHAVVREGLTLILGAQNDVSVVGIAVNGREAVAQAEALQPDIILMDITMPEMNGIEACRLVCKCCPGVKVIMLSMHYTPEHVFRAIQAGARGYLLKESAGSEIVIAVSIVKRGQLYFGNGVEVPAKLLSLEPGKTVKSPLDSLSDRERQVLQYVVEGRTSAEIAVILCLSPKSVETYRSRLMLKLGITSIPDLVKFALQHGITPAA